MTPEQMKEAVAVINGRAKPSAPKCDKRKYYDP